MVGKHNFVRVAENIWEIPPTFRDDMRVPARVYADEDLLDAALGDNSVVQLVNTATLPGVIKHAIAMPDIHQGYGFPIGGVVATRLPQGVISPGGVGYDINCGVRLLVSQAAVEEDQTISRRDRFCSVRELPKWSGLSWTSSLDQY